jgi:hypothetical protein
MRSIDSVLGRVYRKLEIGSRAELGAIMATEERGASQVVSAT